MMRIVMMLCAVALLSGCASIYQTNNSVMAEGLLYVYKDYVVDITSEPSGAKITWNGEDAGTAPTKRVLNGRRGMCAPAVVTATWEGTDKKPKTINIPGTAPIPRELNFK